MRAIPAALVAMLLVLAGAGQALAEKPPHAQHKAHALHGRVTADATINLSSGGSFTLATKDGNVLVQVNSGTKVHTPGKKSEAMPTSIVLRAGIRVVVQGEFTSPTSTPPQFTARRLGVLPKNVHAVGTVKSMSGTAPGSTLVITTSNNGDVTFTVGADTKVRPEGTSLADVQALVGNVSKRVTVVGRYDLASGNVLARKVVVHEES